MSRSPRYEYNKQYRINNREYLCKRGMLENCRHRAKLGNFECSLVIGDIQIPSHCPILGIPLQHGFESGRDTSPSVDRIDTTKGYTKDNIHIISYKANRIKSNATPEELIAIGKYLVNLRDNGITGRLEELDTAQIEEYEAGGASEGSAFFA